MLKRIVRGRVLAAAGFCLMGVSAPDTATVQTDEAAIGTADTQIRAAVGSGAIGGQNNDLYDELCARADKWVCASMRNQADIEAYGARDGRQRTTEGNPILSYAPATDTDPERQDALKYRFPAFVMNATPKTLAVGLAATPAGTIEEVHLSSRAGMAQGRPIRIGDEILVCIAPVNKGSCLKAGSTTAIYAMRGTYGTASAAHEVGAQVALYVNANPEQFTVPLPGSSTSSETVFMGFDVYFTDDFANLGRTGGSCAGVHNTTINAGASCTTTNGGYKAFQVRTGGNVTWEAKLTTATGRASLVPARLNSNTGGDIGLSVLRHYTTAGPPYYGADQVRPPTSVDWVFRPSTWIRAFILLETNHDDNTAAFQALAPLKVAMTDLPTDTALAIDMAGITVNSKGEGSLEYHILGSSRGQMAGRRIRIGSEIMALFGCSNGAVAAKAAGQYNCTVVRAVDGTSIAAHSSGATVEYISDYYSLWYADETHDPVLVLDRVPTTRSRKRNVGVGVPTAVSGFNFELDDSSSRMTAHRHQVAGFGDLILYVKNFWSLRKAGTGGAGGRTIPAEWAKFLVKPTVRGN